MNASVLLGDVKSSASHRPVVNLLKQGVRRSHCNANPRHSALSRQLSQERSRTSFPASVSKSTQRGSLYICPLRSHSKSKASISSKHSNSSSNRSSASLTCWSQAVSGPASGTALTEVLATLTGYCVLIGSVFRSIPQIIRIVTSSSVEGLSLTSFVSELIAYTVMWAYNLNLGYPFSTFGEIVACWFQDIVLVALVLFYRKEINVKVVFWTLLFAAFMVVTMTNTCGMSILYGLQVSTILMISLGARLPQIWMNYKRGNSGELSLLTCLLNVMGCFARMFTTVVLTKDKLNFIAAVVQAVLNGVLLYQTVETAREVRNAAANKAKTA